VEGSVTLADGVYGVATIPDDIKDGRCTPPSPAVGWTFDVRAKLGEPIVASARTDSSGFYQIELAPGTYVVCATECVGITVTAGARTRVDLELVPYAMLSTITPPPC
jgi:hypothetical protein